MCLATLLAQVGAWLPAEEASLSPVDAIFVRMGAKDHIMMGQSTFLVELSETAGMLATATKCVSMCCKIATVPSPVLFMLWHTCATVYSLRLRCRCRRSLVALDELGRGTATMDGQAIASAVLQEVVQRIGCRGVFATHYHLMADHWADHSGVAVNHMACDVENFPDSVVPKVKHCMQYLVPCPIRLVARMPHTPCSSVCMEETMRVCIDLQRGREEFAGRCMNN